MFMLNNGGAQANAIPDVCKVPSPAGPVPTPFPNLATTQMAQPSGLLRNVLVVNMPALNQASKIMMSSGDEVGTVGGVASNRIKGEVQFMNGSMTVMVGGKPAVRMGCMTGHNGMPVNAVGTVISPSQSTVMVGS